MSLEKQLVTTVTQSLDPLERREAERQSAREREQRRRLRVVIVHALLLENHRDGEVELDEREEGDEADERVAKGRHADHFGWAGNSGWTPGGVEDPGVPSPGRGGRAVQGRGEGVHQDLDAEGQVPRSSAHS